VTADTGKPVQVFKKGGKNVWTRLHVTSFAQYQWRYLAPFFYIKGTRPGTIVHHVLNNNDILPFIEDNEGMPTPLGYGNATVWSIKIHESHHNGDQNEVSLRARPSRIYSILIHVT
jgi:hypothetical protein